VTNRQSNLLSKAHQKLSASRDLLRQGHPEDAVSRAYYVMFFVAEAFLDGEGLRFSSHAAVITVFQKAARFLELAGDLIGPSEAGDSLTPHAC